ncbi:MAG: class I SAM-dependent methyltransferase [Planctomycetota bacterium]|jgi:SAM-dependent methyltransferase
MMTRLRTVPAVAACLLAATLSAGRGAHAASAREMLEKAGVTGGLVVHLGCGTGELTAALRAGDGYLVHGLDADPAKVSAARRRIAGLGLYGPVSVDTFDGKRLPYVNSLANLIVSDGPTTVQHAEIMRCLAPLGVALIDGRKTVKPWPNDIDEWTHYLHGPGNNAVAADTVVGPPRHMQWLAGPEWTRHHHHDKGTHPAYRALVSAKGRLFYVVDEATPAQIRVASRWRLVARDAFSGVELWKKPLPATKFQRKLHELWRYIVADGERVYLPHEPGEPLTAHDQVTGDVVRTYPETAGLEEVILADGTLLTVIEGESIVAVSAPAGGLLWRWKPPDGAGLVPLTLAADAGRAFVKSDAPPA